MECEEYRGESEVEEADSDHEDADSGGDGTWLGHPLHDFHTDLDSYETGTVRRRTKTVVTPKMAMESFRLSFLNDGNDQDVNFDAILGELCELECQLNSTQNELSRSLGAGANAPPPPAAFQDCGENGGSSDTLHVSEQEELDALAAEITQGLNYPKPNGHLQQHHPHHHQHQQHHHPNTTSHQHQHHGSQHGGAPTHHHHHQQHHPHQHHHMTLGMLGVPGHDSMSSCDTAETDSAFSDNASLPSSESFTSMVTVSSSAETTSSSSGETCSMSSAMLAVNHTEEEQNARMKAEKIRIALEKIKEAKIRKLFVRAFAKDGSSKSILVDEKMNVSQVCSQLADKNHMKLNHRLAVVELMPELLMERILEDHDSLVESMVMWTKDSKNKVMFEERLDKYDLFRSPEKYLLAPSAAKTGPLAPPQKDKLIQEFFGPNSACVPAVEGALYLKSDGKKAWKKFFFVLRASGLYYNPKGKASKNPKDLVCLVQFEYVEVYRGLGWKKKYHAPSDFCFALKHPQIQKKTSKYIRYFCAETELALDQWVMGIRTVKLGKQMLHNYERLTHEISMWDIRQTSGEGVSPDESVCHLLNHADMNDSRMSVPEPGSRHSVIQVHNSSLVRGNSSATGEGARDIMSIEVLAIPPRKGFEHGGGPDQKSLNGSVGSSVSSTTSESGHKTPVKRVSFSATHSIINGDSGEQIIKHRDSIISASTDSSEDSNSSGENRQGSTSFRGKMRAKLPLSTETTRQLADMCNVPVDETPEAIYAETSHHSSRSSSSQGSGLARTDRRRASMTERRGSASSGGEPIQKFASQSRASPLSPQHKQHSVDSAYGTHHIKHNSSSSSADRSGHHHHVRRKSEPSVSAMVANGEAEDGLSHDPLYDSNPLYSTAYASARDAQPASDVGGGSYNIESDYGRVGQTTEPLYNQIRSPLVASNKEPHIAAMNNGMAIPPPLQFREIPEEEFNHPPPLPPPAQQHEPSPPLPPPPPPSQLQQSTTAPPPLNHVKSMQVPPPPPPVAAKSQNPASQGPATLGPSPQGPPATLRSQSPIRYEPKPNKAVPPSAHVQPTVAKSSPPPTLPKPPANNSSSATHPSTPPPPPPAVLPKNPPPPLRLVSNESTCSSLSEFDSVTGSPLHVPIPPPMAPISPKLPPPPTLPKTTVPNPFNNIKSPSAVAATGGPSTQSKSQSPKVNGYHVLSPMNINTPEQGKIMNTSSSSSPSSSSSSLQRNGPEQGGHHNQQSSLPFLSELSKRSHSIDSEKESNVGLPHSPLSSSSLSSSASGATSPAGVQHHRRSASAGSNTSKGDRKAPPPPPPKRSENTRLSVSKEDTPPPPPAAAKENGGQNGNSGSIHGPIYENFDGMMDINDLPPPPPEFLADLNPQTESSDLSRTSSGSGKKAKPPPPPPKRSKETHLSSH